MKTVFKLKKIQTLQHLANIGKHCYEISELERSEFDRVKCQIFKRPIWTLIGNSNKLYRDVKNLKDRFNLEKRKNSAVGVEIVLSMSPDFFDSNFEDAILRDRVKDFTNRSIKFITDKFGRDRIAHAVLHLHETTPHIHILLVPWEEQNKRGRYASAPYRLIKTKSITPQFLSNIQNDYWNLFSDYGLNPLQKKRTGKITSLKDHYINSIERAKNLENSLSEKEQLISEQKSEISKLTRIVKSLIASIKKLIPFSKFDTEKYMENRKNKNSEFFSDQTELNIYSLNSEINNLEIEKQNTIKIDDDINHENNNEQMKDNEKQKNDHSEIELPRDANINYGNRKIRTQDESNEFELPIYSVDRPEKIKLKSNKPKIN